MKTDRHSRCYEAIVSAKRGVLGATAGAAVLLSSVASAHGDPVVVYKETFGFCTASRGQAAAQETNWEAYKAGARFGRFGNLKVFSYGSLKTGGSVNSGPLGLSQGYAFWYKPVYGLSIITSELQFDAALLRDHDTVIEYEQRLSGANEVLEPNGTQLAFLIDNKWYISKQSVPQAKFGAWHQVSVVPSALQYGETEAVAGVGPVAPVTYDSSLPMSGRVMAFGVFIPEVNGRVRLDNFTLKTGASSAAAFSTAIQDPNTSLCPETSPDRAGGTPPPTPIPDPGGDDGDQGEGDKPEQEKPDEPLPVSLCSGRQQGGYGRVVGLSPKMRASILGKIKGSTVLAQRDRTFITLLATRRMPIGAVVNVSVGDFNPTTRTLKVRLSPRGAVKSIRLAPRSAAMLSSYIQSLGSSVSAQTPIFAQVKLPGGSLDLTKAACVNHLTAVLSRRARAAKVALASLVVSSVKRYSIP